MILYLQNIEHKHRTQVWVMKVTEELPEWEDSQLIGRKRQWFSIQDALIQLAQHKPIQRSYLHSLYNTNPLHNNPNFSLNPYQMNSLPSIQLVNSSNSSFHCNKHSH